MSGFIVFFVYVGIVYLLYMFTSIRLRWEDDPAFMFSVMWIITVPVAIVGITFYKLFWKSIVRFHNFIERSFQPPM